LAAVLIRRARKLYLNEDLGLELKNTVYALDILVLEFGAFYVIDRGYLHFARLIRPDHNTCYDFLCIKARPDGLTNLYPGKVDGLSDCGSIRINQPRDASTH
jgi:hypothetical protein